MFTNQADTIRIIREKAKGMRVLYVEDDPLIAHEYITFLSRFFEHIHHVSNGAKGLESALNSRFDLIITDVQMPQIDGLEMIERIKEHIPGQSVLLVSAYKDVEYLHRSVQLGIDGYLFKPIERNQTIDTLHKIVSKIKMEHDNLRYKHRLEELVEEKTREVIETYTIDRISGLNSLGKLEQDILKHPECSLVLMKIADFKNLNDTYGYQTGNAVLQQTADILSTIMQENGSVDHYTLYRTSGAHFALLSSCALERLEALVHRIIHTFESTEILVEEERMYLEMNAAIVNPNDELSLSHADFSLRQAEREGVVVIYRPAEHRNHEHARKLKCIDTIKRALKENRFVPYYQPIVDNTTLEIAKYESLARLIMPDGEVLSPARFLPIAKATKMYAQITRRIVTAVLEDFRDSECSVSINLSIEDIAHHPTREFLFAQIAAFPEPHRLVFELLESEGIESYTEIQNFFAKLKELGCKVALDDFGSGYSNFEYLVKLNVDYIKIDGSLIHTIDTDYVSQSIVEMLTAFADKMGIKTIAEFVGTKKISASVSTIGVDESQGFLFGKPEPFEPSMLHIQTFELEKAS